MQRSVVIILLLLQMLVGPAGSFAHVHPDLSAGGTDSHAARPHLHVGVHGHFDGHSHRHAGHHDHQPAQPKSAQQKPGPSSARQEADASAPSFEPATSDSHDSTAVYLGTDDFATVPASPGPCVSKAGSQLSQADGLGISPFSFPGPVFCRLELRSAHEQGPVYLRHRALRL